MNVLSKVIHGDFESLSTSKDIHGILSTNKYKILMNLENVCNV